jgi:hypothetical protein
MHISAGQQAFEAATDGAVALAGHLFEPSAIRDRDNASTSTIAMDPLVFLAIRVQRRLMSAPP